MTGNLLATQFPTRRSCYSLRVAGHLSVDVDIG